MRRRGFARDMLAIKDHLDRALAAVSDELRADQTAANFLAGIEATARELEAAFARNGVTRIASKGEKLDPHQHQAMIEVPKRRSSPARSSTKCRRATCSRTGCFARRWLGSRKRPINALRGDGFRLAGKAEARLDRA